MIGLNFYVTTTYREIGSSYQLSLYLYCLKTEEKIRVKQKIKRLEAP